MPQKKASEEDINRLKNILAVHHNCLKTTECYSHYDIEFHRILAEIPGNKILQTIHTAFSEWLIMAKPLEKNNMTYTQNKNTHLQHIEILQAIIEHDADKAESLMEIHLQRRLS